MKHLDWDEIWRIIEEDEISLAQEQRNHVQICSLCQQRMESAKQAHRAVVHHFPVKDSTSFATADEKLLQYLNQQVAGGKASDERQKEGKNRRILHRAYAWGSVSAAVLLFGGLTVFALHGVNHLNSTVVSSTVAVGSPSSSAQNKGLMSTENDTAKSATTSDTTSASGERSGVNQIYNGQMNDAKVTSTFSVTVTTPDGQPVSNAHVAVIVHTNVLASWLTGGDGKVPTFHPEQMFSGNSEKGVPELVVWKDGFAPAVGSLWMPQGQGSIQVALNVPLSEGNGSTPNSIPGTQGPSTKDAETAYQFARLTVGP